MLSSASLAIAALARVTRCLLAIHYTHVFAKRHNSQLYSILARQAGQEGRKSSKFWNRARDARWVTGKRRDWYSNYQTWSLSLVVCLQRCTIRLSGTLSNGILDFAATLWWLLGDRMLDLSSLLSNVKHCRWTFDGLQGMARPAVMSEARLVTPTWRGFSGCSRLAIDGIGIHEGDAESLPVMLHRYVMHSTGWQGSCPSRHATCRSNRMQPLRPIQATGEC